MAPLARQSSFDNNSSDHGDSSTSRAQNRRSVMALGWMGKSMRQMSMRSLSVAPPAPVTPPQPSKKIEENDDASVASTTSNCSDDNSQNSSGSSAFHTVETPVFGILAYLEDNGVPAHIIDELHQLESQYKFTTLLKEAESCVELLVRRKAVSGDLEEVLSLFVKAWTALRDYAQDRYVQIDEAAQARTNKYYAQVIAFQNKSVWEQDWLRQRQIAAHDADAEAAFSAQHAQAMRFKIDCQKGLVLTQEWARYLRRMQRSQRQ